ncbi:diguanylate cyclase [Mycobacterium sp. GA-1199]|uniref:GGDEF domain-containing protein n=1 Tax=Mycobacterium sp. GA-1199 TaxID=1772287 RepID=UPI00074B18C3|nr:GGDEF domain-containing protein [Mycobacterium sp. GA-1199]KUI42955.1 diguanylate cyclase [Mycobacterium sp. GA-1199]
MRRWVRRWFTQPDQYDWISAYLNERGLQLIWRHATFGYTMALATLPIIMLWSPLGPNTTATIAIAIAAAVLGVAGGLLWILRWPTRRQSVMYSVMSTAAIAATCLALSSPYAGLMGCVTFAVLGGFISYFHTLGHMVANFAVAAGCSTVLAYRLVTATGDVALTSAAVLTVVSLNVGVPFGIQSLMHTLRTDLRGSDRDPLTGLHNRRSFHSSVYEVMMRHHRLTDTYLVMAMIDLDNFKRLNDTRGHAAGDQALTSVGAALRENSRSAAVIGRLGGEEFVVADIDTNPNPAEMAERLRRAIEKIPFPVTASIGTASAGLESYSAGDNLQLIDDLIRHSDTAMYEAKRAGGNRVCHYAAPTPTCDEVSSVELASDP